MSDIKALDKLRELGGEVVDYRWGVDFDRAVDDLEREVSQRVAELNGAICERDGRIGSYERRNTELNNALKAICKRFGVSTEWSAEDTAKKVLDALEQGWMELPCDADGVPIRCGDVMGRVDGGPTRQVACVCGAGFTDIDTPIWCARDFRHVNPRTIEDVLRDCCNEWNEHCGDEWESGVYAKYAEEIRGMMT